MADHAQDLTVSIEYKPAEPRARTLLSSTGSVLALIAETGRENLAVTLDFAHMLMAHETPGAVHRGVLGAGTLKGLQLNDGWGAADDGLAMGSVTSCRRWRRCFYLVRDGYGGTYYFDTDPIRENPVRECEVNIERTKQLLATRPAAGGWWAAPQRRRPGRRRCLVGCVGAR